MRLKKRLLAVSEAVCDILSAYQRSKAMTKATTRLAFINADWRDFQNKPAVDEDREASTLIDDYLRILNKTGWQHTHIIQAPCHRNASVRELYPQCKRREYSG
jgi:hypothetical protein